MHKWLLLLFLSMLFSCTQDEFHEESSILAVEGWIEHDKYPVVMVTKTLPVGSKTYNTHHLEDYLVKWAKVSVIHNRDTVVLTGKYDKGYFPPYIYTTSRIKGKSGETYKLLVEYEDLFAWAITTVQDPPEIDSFKVDRCVGSDSLYQIKACMDLTHHRTDYYQFFVRVGAQKKQFLACFLGYLDGSTTDSLVEFPVYRGREVGVHNGSTDYTPYFSLNDSVAVKCCTVDRMGYDYWKTFVESEYLSGAAMLGTTINLPSNIIGGTGYWFGYGSTTSYFIIKDFSLGGF